MNVFKNNKGRAVPVLVALAVLAFAPASARADFLDPATLHIGGPVPTGGGDPNLIGNTGLVNVFQNQDNVDSLTQPWLLIVGVANDTTGTAFGNGANLIQSVTSFNDFNNPVGVAGTGQLGGPNKYGGTWNTLTGFAGFMTSGGEA